MHDRSDVEVLPYMNLILFGQKFSVGLNFADEGEASKFHQAVETKLHEREKRASECIGHSPWAYDSVSV